MWTVSHLRLCVRHACLLYALPLVKSQPWKAWISGYGRLSGLYQPLLKIPLPTSFGHGISAYVISH